MAGLPEGWEWDYDGTRWFYKYTPTGHIQYHFPSEGDEFPDFVDDATPVPTLAPEERLESQQQIKRHGSTGTNARTSTGTPAKEAGGKSRMSASARPVSSVWEDEGGDEGVFQPENFMFLGPGTYNDVSPLAEEEEEAARRIVAGGIEQRVDLAPSKGVSPTPSKGVSPVASERTTPQVANSEVNRASVQLAPPANQFLMGGFVMREPMVQAPPPEPTVHMIDSREIGQPQQFDPVGFVAEMPSEDVALSPSETNPDPIEMADNSVLAPIETAVPEGYFELADTTTPMEQKSRADETKMNVETIRQQQRLRQQQVQEHKRKQKQLDSMEQDDPSPSSDKQRLKEDESRGYQAYKPSAPGSGVPAKPGSTRPEGGKDERRMTMFNEQSHAVGARTNTPSNVSHADIPAALAPRVPPKQPFDRQFDPKAPPPPNMSMGPGPAPGVPPKIPHSQGMGHVPSVLKPARTTSPAPPSSITNGQGPQTPEANFTKYPSVLRPARGRAISQPGQQPQFQSLNPSQGPQPGHAYVPPKAGQHPPSMTPSPMKQQQQQQTNAEPRMDIQRVNTLPEQGQSGKPARPLSMIPGAQPPLPDQQQQNGQRPLRPMSVMPGMMAGGGALPGQQGPGMQQQQHQAMGLHQNRVQGMSSTVPPTQAVPFSAPPGEVTAGQNIARHTTPYPPDDPKPIRRNTAPYPPDDPKPVRQNTAPYPDDEARPLRRQSTAPYPDDHPIAQTPPNNRRHSAMGGDISPDSRPTSMAFSLKTPSPMESRRTSAAISLSQSSLSPSPPNVQGAGQVPSLGSGSGRMPPPQNDPSSYFPEQNIEGQGHAVAAQNKLRKKSLGRADSAKRNSLPPGQSPLSAAPPSINPEMVNQAQQLRQAQQGGAPPPQLTPGGGTVPYPGSPPMGPQGLGSIQERDEVANMALSRSSSRSHRQTRRSSLTSAQPSPMSSRRQSLQEENGPDMHNNPPQGALAPVWHKGSLPPQQMVPGQGQMPPAQGPNGKTQQGPMYPPGQAPTQPLAPLMRKPSKGQAPHPSQVPPRGPLSPPGQMLPGNQMLPRGQMPPDGLMPPQGQMPLQGPPPLGQGSLQTKLPKTQAPQPQIPLQGQMPSQAQVPPQGQPPSGPSLLRKSSKAQAPPNQLQPQGQVRPQGQRPVSMQFPPQRAFPGQGQPQPGQMQHQRTHSQGPPIPGGPMPPQGQNPHMRMPSQGGAPNGKMYPPVQIPQGQPQWNPNNMPSPTARPGSVPPPTTAETPKEKKWFKWLKGGSKSAASSPATQGPSQVSTFSVMSTNRPGPTGWATNPPPLGEPNIAPAQQQFPAQYPPSGNLPPGVTPLNINSNPIPPCHGPRPPEPMSAPPTQAPSLEPPMPMPVSETPSPVQNEPLKAHPPFEEFKNLSAKAPSPVQPRPAAARMEPHRSEPPPQTEPPQMKHLQMEPPQMEPPRMEPPRSEPLQSKPPFMEPLRVAPPVSQSKESQLVRSPHPSERSPHPSDVVHSPSSQEGPGLRDSFSDTGSISTTIEVSEAQPQPVLKPQVVQVNRRSTDLQSLAHAQASVKSSMQSSGQPPTPAQVPNTPPGGQYPLNERSSSPEWTPSTFSLPSQRPHARPDPPQEDDERSMTPAPLFSGPNSPSSNKSSIPSPPIKSPPTKHFEPAPVMEKAVPAPVEDKWAKNAAADYSGGDWGDDDDWDY